MSDEVRKKVRMMRGRMHNVSIGKIGGGRPPFGYAINKDKYFIVDPNTSKIVERFFLQYSKGDTTIADIAKELKEEGLFPKTSFDTLQQNLLLWLDRDYYIGKFPYPQIISKSLFNKVQSVRKKRKCAPKKKYNNRFLLKGLLYEGESGKMLSGWHEADAYMIAHPEKKGIHISRKLIDPLVWDYAKGLYHKHLMNPTILKRQLQKDLAVIGKKVDTVRTEIKTIKEKVDKVEERMIFGNLSNKRGEELIENLKEQLSDKERRLLQLINETIYKQQQMVEAEFLGDFNEDTMTLEDRIAIVKKVIKKIAIVKPSKYTAHISIYNGIDDKVSVYEMKSNIRSKDRGCIKKYEYHLKEKKTS